MKNFDGSSFPEGLTFDDVLLLPGFSDFLPYEANLEARISRHVTLKVPVVSAAMDTVTEHRMAIQMALLGGLGVLHRNMTSERQAEEVRRVKAFAFDRAEFPDAAVDTRGRLLVAAAVGVSGALDRARALVDAGVDLLAIDTAHGHSRNVVETLKELKASFPVDVIAGNIATADAAECLIEAGADGLKTGIGPGSICTTRVVAGVGVPQISAIRAVSSVAQLCGVPVIADGGIQYSGDLTKAIAAGADTVMLGSLLARTRESAGQEILLGGRSYKVYRGMGSLGALQNETNDRYGKNGSNGAIVPEGVEGMVPLGGSVAELLYQLLGGLRKGMGYCGLRTIADLKSKAQFIRISNAAVRESHAHDVMITQDAPNYSRPMA